MSSGKHRSSFLLGVSALVIGMAALVFISGPQSDMAKTNHISGIPTDSPSTTRTSDRGPSKPSSGGSHSGLAEKLNALLAEADERDQSEVLYDLMLEAPLEEVRELLALSDGTEEYSAGFREEMKLAAFERWHHLDPAEALRAIAASSLSADRRDSRIELYLEDWAGRAPQEVRAFLQEEGLAGVSQDVIDCALARGAAASGERAMFEDALGRIEEPKRRNFTIKSVARTLQRDHEALFDAWVPTLPSEDQATAIAESAWMLVDQDPDRALARLDQLEELGTDELSVTRSRVAVKWTRKDPVKAGQWVLTQNLVAEEREELVSLVFKVWMSKDRDAAVAWAEDSIKRGAMDEAFMNRVAERLQP
ncbi:hypothetical protein [Haloferula rosea]|uniref:Uncharacterized protein n=1 Tax=Haloferula rosea TaxID=490093 RepID=A0A934R9P3_9BACT|nr:hypothetical protein [Haloferula rosea]MBK1826583.1 hypothetical protein [Haloferula rosea]